MRYLISLSLSLSFFFLRGAEMFGGNHFLGENDIDKRSALGN